jgi:predicted RNA-binding protein (virulence factor B family)
MAFVSLGRRNLLPIVRQSVYGTHLDGGKLGEILLLAREYVDPDETSLDVFVYLNSEDRLTATRATPLAMVGEFASLKVNEFHTQLGAFLDWGLSKDLLLPMREQVGHVRAGQRVVVYIKVDERSQRINATMKLHPYLNRMDSNYSVGQEVSLLIASRTDLGFNALLPSGHIGLLYHSELNTPLEIGDNVIGYIRTVREDGKIDLGLDLAGARRLPELAQRILSTLKAAGGSLPYGDDSSPQDIRDFFSMSKKAFKQALGTLYKQRLVKIEPDGISLQEK